MTKRSLKQIEESLRSKFAETSDDNLINAIKSMDDPYHLGGRGQPQQIDIGLGGAGRTGSSKPRVSLQKAKELGIVKPDPKVWRKASDIPTLTDVIPSKQPKVWRRGEPEAVIPPAETAQEKLVALAQQRAKETGEPTLAVTSPWASKMLDRLFPEKLSDLTKQRVEPKLDEDNKTQYSKDDYIGWAKKYAEQYQVPVPMVLHAMFKETGWLKDPEKMRTATSPTGARGVMQIQPEYAEKGAYKIKVKDLTDPEKNIEAGVRGLSYYLNKHKTPEKALAAYNAGEGGAAKFLKTGDIKFLPKETKKYIQGYKDDVIHQLEKFYPKNNQKVAQIANDVLATAVGAKDVQAADEIPKTVTQKGKPPGSKYTTTDTQGKTTTYTKDNTGQWVSTTGEIMPMPKPPQAVSAKANATPTDSVMDKLKRVIGGELPSQVFGDKKKPAASTTTPAPVADKNSKGFLDQATDVVKQFSQPGVAGSVTATSPLVMPAMVATDILSKKLSGEKTPEPAKPATKQSVSGVINYPQRTDTAPRATAVAPKSSINLQRDQSGLVQAKKLSDFEKAFAAARREKGAGDVFTFRGKQYTTNLAGETPIKKSPAAVSTATDLDKKPDAVIEPTTQPDEIEAIIQSNTPDVTPDAPMPTDAEIEAGKALSQKHLADIDRELADKALVKESINTALQDILKLAGRLK